MIYYRSFTGWLICTGITCIFIGLYIGPMFGGIYYVLIGTLMLAVGLIGAYLKYQKESKINKEIRLIRRCPSCGSLLNQNKCPNCGNIT